MQGERGTTLAAVLGLGIALVVGPLPVGAEPGGGALRGPAVAIEKARAAADKEEHRARAHDAQAAAAFDNDAPRAKSEKKAAATTDGVGDADTPQGQAQDQAHDAPVDVPTYDVAAHRDPFRPPRLSGVVDARTPLETYQLGQLKLVGVIAQPSQGYRAMVEDSAGLGYIITTGTPIGSSGGVVRSIEPRRVVIEESTRDFYGDAKPKEVVMELPQEDRSP
jgi:hypothetical protein